jgi:regulator of sigma E protease
MQYLTQVPFFFAAVSILALLLAVIVLVFVHEMGHFLLGRWCGVNIEAFSVGFGRELFGFTDRHGTRWKFAAIPLGGYVRFEGDANVASMPDSRATPSPTSLQGAALWRRFLIVLAGPVANLLLAVAIFTAAFALVGMPVNPPRIDEVVDGGAAREAGLQAGDLIRMIDGRQMKSFADIQATMATQDPTPMALSVERAGQMLNLTLTPKLVEMKDDVGVIIKVTQIGIKHDSKNDPQTYVKSGPLEAIENGAKQTWLIISATGYRVGKIFMGADTVKQFHGPIVMAELAGNYALMGAWPFITFIGFISVTIGLVNLLPIPMLDGGHLLFYLIEGVIGRPVSPVAQEWSFRIGLSAILLLAVFVSTNDIIIKLGH